MVMDSVWYDVALGMGHTAMILPYTTLLDTSFFSTTDVLIISNATVALFPSDIKTILWCIRKGKPVYLQTEYLPEFVTNQAFASIVDSLGGIFDWEENYSGDLVGMKVIGSFATTPNVIPPLDYYWYSVSGTGDCHMMYFLEYGAAYHGFQFISHDPLFGSMITTTDQDWIQERTSTQLMENIITHLINPPDIAEENTIGLSNDTAICSGQTLVLEVVAQNASYEWNDNSNSPRIEVSKPGIYGVTVTLECGIIIDSVIVLGANCSCPVYNPNAFSPNRDNVNDLFTIQFACDVSDYSLMIFDRWGSLVYGSDSIMDTWDGTFHGNISPEGVYAYFIHYTSQEGVSSTIYGNITLIR